MSQMFETDVSKWFPADAPVSTEEKVAELGKVVGFLATTLNTAFERIEQVSADNKKLLGLIERVKELNDARDRVRMDYIERLESLAAQCCGKLNIPVPFPGADSDFGLSPRSKKDGVS